MITRPARRFVWRAAAALGLTVAALTAAVAVTALVARPCLVAGNSMEPALHGDDVILVVRSQALPRPFAHGDIVVVRLMRVNLLGKGPGVPIVKRIVAAAGDVVEAREDDGLYVNGRRLDGVPAPFSAKLVAGVYYRYRRDAGADVFKVTAGGILEPLEPGPAAAVVAAPPDALPAGSFFVLGDNAVVSFDSLRFGPVGADEIEGAAVAVVYPAEHRSRLRGKLPGMAAQSLLEQINSDIANAMRAKDQPKLVPLRMLKSALTNREIEKGHALDERESLQVVTSLVKQRRDSIDQFGKAGRQDLVEREAAEIIVLETYLPPPVSASDLTKTVDDAIASTGAKSPKDMGAVMKAVMAALGGQNVDGKLVSELVKKRLAGVS